MNKLAEWGYVKPEVVYWACHYFVEANKWTLIANQAPKKADYLYTHGNEFENGYLKRKQYLADDAMKKLKEFTDAFKKIHEKAKIIDVQKSKQVSVDVKVSKKEYYNYDTYSEDDSHTIYVHSAMVHSTMYNIDPIYCHWTIIH